MSATGLEVRFGGTPKPAAGTAALPGVGGFAAIPFRANLSPLHRHLPCRRFQHQAADGGEQRRDVHGLGEVFVKARFAALPDVVRAPAWERTFLAGAALIPTRQSRNQKDLEIFSQRHGEHREIPFGFFSVCTVLRESQFIVENMFVLWKRNHAGTLLPRFDLGCPCPAL